MRHDVNQLRKMTADYIEVITAAEEKARADSLTKAWKSRNEVLGSFREVLKQWDDWAANIEDACKTVEGFVDFTPPQTPSENLPYRGPKTVAHTKVEIDSMVQKEMHKYPTLNSMRHLLAFLDYCIVANTTHITDSDLKRAGVVVPPSIFTQMGSTK